MLLNLSPDLSSEERAESIRILKLYLAAHLFLQRSYYIPDLARAVNVSRDTLRDMIDSPEWEEALKFWGVIGERLSVRPEEHSEVNQMQRDMDISLRDAEKIWTDMINAGGHIDPSRMPPLPDNYNPIDAGESPERVNLIQKILARIPPVLRRHAISLVRIVNRLLRSRCN